MSEFKNEKGVISQNAVMHLFESFLEMYKVLPSDSLKADIKNLLSLFKRLFYDDGVKLISEYTGLIPNSPENV